MSTRHHRKHSGDTGPARTPAREAVTRRGGRRWISVALAAAVLGTVSATSLAPARVPAAPEAVVELVLLGSDDQAWVMGGSGTPIPPDDYITGVVDRYITPNFPDFTAANAYGLFTPEGLYPTKGIKNLPLDTSVSQGLTILHDKITEQIGAGKNLVVVGYSQSAAISSLEMEQLAASAQAPDAGQLSFVLLGDPMNPNGGILERFDGLTLPSIGYNFYGATPAGTIYPTDIYTIQYDGLADFPKYPLNILADLNAVAGIKYLHHDYPTLTPQEIGTAVQLPVSPGYGGATDYFFIPTENLPLLEPLRAVPVIGDPLADLIQPDLKVLVDLGYDDPHTTYADVATRFELFPNVDLGDVLQDLGHGAQQGIDNFVGDLSALSLPDVLDELTTLFDAPPGPIGLLSMTPTEIINTLTTMVADDYAVLLPTADLALAMTTSLPTYDVSLFIDALTSGDLLEAFGDPIAADVGLLTLSAGFELLVLLNAATSTHDALTSLIF